MGLIQNKVTVSQPNSHVVVKNAGGLRGLTGETGPQGPQGVPGEAATVTAGTTTTLPAGSDATVQNVGSTSAAIFNFGIPKGDKGDTGETGAAATISVGSTSTLPAGSSATVTNSGTSSAAVFDFGIPKGDKGDTGATGADGYSPSATVTKTGDTATITITDKDGTTTASISDGSTPTVNDGTLTIQKNGTTVQTFSADQASNVTANITVPTQFSELSGTVSSSQIEDEAITTGSVSGTGTNITLAGTMEGGAIESVELNGDTEQQTYSGKNLLNITKGTFTQNGITFTQNPDGSVTMNGTSTGNAYYEMNNTAASQTTITSGVRYTLSIGNVTLPSGQVIVQLRKVNPNAVYCAVNNKSASFTAPETTTTFTYIGVYGSGVTLNNVTIYPMLEVGSSMTSFEPYVGGTASPNPDYPQEVQTVTGRQAVTISDGGSQSQEYEINLGKNLFDKDNANVMNVWAGTDYVYSGDALRTLYIPCDPNTTYTVQKENTGTNNRFMVFTTAVRPVVGAPVLNYVGTSGAEDNNSRYTITTPANARYLCVFFANINVTTPAVEDILATIQIEKGSTATTYAPYIQAFGKNLLDKSSASASLEGYFNNANVSLNAGTRMAYIPCLPNTTYTVSKISSKRFAVATTTVVPDDGVAVSGYINDNTGTSITITTDSSAKYICVFYYLSTSDTLTPQEILDTLQIEKGSTATTYEPNMSGQLELCKIGTYQDYIYKSGEDWYVKKNIGNAVFDGSEAWGVASTNPNMYYLANAVSPAVVEYPSGYSNYFTVVTRYPNQHLGELAIRGANKTDLMIRYDSMADVTALTTWFGTHNTSLYYPLATATDIQITNATLIAQLEDLFSATTYAGTTYITVSGDLASPLEVVAEADSKLAPDSVYGAAIKDGAVSVDKIADLKALADALAPYLNS